MTASLQGMVVNGAPAAPMRECVVPLEGSEGGPQGWAVRGALNVPLRTGEAL